MAQTRTTRMNVPEHIRQNMAELLNRNVTDLTDLLVQTKLAHWNVRGSHFIAYHKLFDELAGDLISLVDTVAERATALGAIAGVPVQSIASQTSLPVWPLQTTLDSSVLESLIERWAIVANNVREAIVTSEEADPDTSDLFTEVSRQLDKDLWFLEAHVSN